MQILKDKRGDAELGTIVFLIVFIVIVSITMEVSRVYTIRNHVEKELSRAANLSVEIAMLDEYRKDAISRIDVPAAQAAFTSYLHSDMQLNASNAFIADGQTEYRLIITGLAIDEAPPKIRIEGTITIPVSVLHDYLEDGIAFTIPFEIATRNQRLDV